MPKRKAKEERITLYTPHIFFMIHCPYCERDFSYQAIIRLSDEYDVDFDYSHRTQARFCPFCGYEIETRL